MNKKRNTKHGVPKRSVHPNTNRANTNQHSLTLVIERESVVPTWYARWLEKY